MRVIMFVKFPVPGRVKTRLGSSIGPEQAARLQTCFVRDELATLHQTGADVVLYCDPCRSRHHYRDLYGRMQRYETQTGDDLGQRMHHALNRELTHGPVLLIGSDLPDLPACHLQNAWQALQKTDICLGPTPDGGFHLIGIRRPLPADVFKAVPWSTPTVLRKTVDNLQRLDLPHILLASWPDVDTVDDLTDYVRRNREQDTRTMRHITQQRMLEISQELTHGQ